MKKSHFLIVFAIAILLGALILYFLTFSHRLSLNNSDWGSFGDYLAGSVGIVFSLLTFILIYLTFYDQRRIIFENTFHQLVLNYNNLINLIHERWLHTELDRDNKPVYKNGREIFGNAVGYIGKKNQKDRFIEIYTIHINVFHHYFNYLIEVIETIKNNNELKPINKITYYRRFSSTLSFFELVMLAYYVKFMVIENITRNIIIEHFIFRLFELEQTEKVPHKEQLLYIINELKL
jgi:hypothetical protein